MPTESTQPPTPTFTQSVEALESILEKFKTGNIPLEDALTLFEDGVGHLKLCQQKLTEARGRVEELVTSLREGGQAVTKPFECGE